MKNETETIDAINNRQINGTICDITCLKYQLK